MQRKWLFASDGSEKTPGDQQRTKLQADNGKHPGNPSQHMKSCIGTRWWTFVIERLEFDWRAVASGRSRASKYCGGRMAVPQMEPRRPHSLVLP